MTDPSDALAEVRDALRHAKNTFYRYAELHRAKQTEEGDEKACTNAGMGEEMARAIAVLDAFQRPAVPVEAVARVTLAMAEALKAYCTTAAGICYAVTYGPCPQEGGWPTEVDGEFDLELLAEAAIAAMGATPVVEAEVDKLAKALASCFDRDDIWPELAETLTELLPQFFPIAAMGGASDAKWFDKVIRDFADQHGPSGGAWNISMLLEHFHRAAMGGASDAKPLVWSPEAPPDATCSYDHCEAKTPFGIFQIEWKSWKDYPSFGLTFGAEYIDSSDSLDAAKQIASEWFTSRLRAALGSE